jgi:hypothetical protein
MWYLPFLVVSDNLKTRNVCPEATSGARLVAFADSSS